MITASANRGSGHAAVDTATFLFTDIEGSSRLWEREPERMQSVIAAHDRLCRAAVQGRGGIVVKTVGDGVYARFEAPQSAVRAVIDLQDAIADPAATGGVPLRVRCGLHCGAAEHRDDDYFGPAVNRTARIAGAAHGGQILLSQAMVDRVRDVLPDEVSLRDLGAVRLRDLSSPERIHQLLHPRLQPDFPALRSLDSTPNNLPQQISSFVGREFELAAAARLLAGTRLLTLVGPGGIGKTRLSLHVAADALDAFPDGVWLVPLAALSDPALVPKAVAQALGVREQPQVPLVQALREHVRERRLLILLDNCEHLVDACASLADALLGAARGIVILASSREPLHVGGEQLYALQPLSLPDAREDAGAAARSDAVRLFVERARLQDPGFAPTGPEAAAVAAICTRLDGIPLALELAAARVAVLPVAQIAERLNDRFRLLTGGSRTALPRQRTLRALIDWSYDLLTAQEKEVFARLSVFAGGWTLDAAEAVVAFGEIRRDDVLDLLAGLVDKSLVVPDDRGSRFRMLETIRQYALECLERSGGAVASRMRHCHHFVDLAERAEPALDGSPEQPKWLERLDLEHDNLRAALAWTLEEKEPTDVALRICAAIYRFWAHRGHAQEACHWCATALAHTAGMRPTAARARALHAAGTLAWRLGNVTDAWTLLRQSLDLSRELGDRVQESRALSNLGGVAIHRADAAAADACLSQAAALHRELGNPVLEGRTLNNLAALAIGQGRYDAAKAPLERALVLARAAGNRQEEANTISHLGSLAQNRGDHAEAKALHERALAIAREFGVREFEIEQVRHLAEIATAQDDVAAARAHYRESLTLSDAVRNLHEVALSLESMTGLAVALGDLERAAHFLGVADALRAANATPREAADRKLYDQAASRCRESMGPAGYEAALAAGRVAVPDAVVAGALDWLRA